MLYDEDTKESYRLIVSLDEIYNEADGLSENDYLMQRGIEYSNRLGIGGKKVVDFDMVEDAVSGGWVLIFSCERYF
jgi:hypothetical protein